MNSTWSYSENDKIVNAEIGMDLGMRKSTLEKRALLFVGAKSESF